MRMVSCSVYCCVGWKISLIYVAEKLKICCFLFQMQDCGQPPKDLVGDLGSVVTFDEHGNPRLPGLESGATDPSQCSVMWRRVPCTLFLTRGCVCLMVTTVQVLYSLVRSFMVKPVATQYSSKRELVHEVLLCKWYCATVFFFLSSGLYEIKQVCMRNEKKCIETCQSQVRWENNENTWYFYIYFPGIWILNLYYSNTIPALF